MWIKIVVGIVVILLALLLLEGMINSARETVKKEKERIWGKTGVIRHIIMLILVLLQIPYFPIFFALLNGGTVEIFETYARLTGVELCALYTGMTIVAGFIYWNMIEWTLPWLVKIFFLMFGWIPFFKKRKKETLCKWAGMTPEEANRSSNILEIILEFILDGIGNLFQGGRRGDEEYREWIDREEERKREERQYQRDYYKYGHYEEVTDSLGRRKQLWVSDAVAPAGCLGELVAFIVGIFMSIFRLAFTAIKYLLSFVALPVFAPFIAGFIGELLLWLLSFLNSILSTLIIILLATVATLVLIVHPILWFIFRKKWGIFNCENQA